jgi:hypothetical protein
MTSDVRPSPDALETVDLLERLGGYIAGRRMGDQPRTLLYLALDRSHVDQVFIWRQVEALCPASDGDDERVTLVVQALRACQHDCGNIGLRTYTKWWSRHTRPHPHPSPSQVRRWVGGWLEARRLAGVDPDGDLRARRLLSSGFKYSDEEILVSIELWASEQPGTLRQSDYVKWAQRERTKDQPRVRAPVRPEVCRRLGGWYAVLGRLGLADRATLTVRRKSETWPTTRYTREDLLAVLRQAADEIGELLPVFAYNQWARQRNSDDARAGRPPSAPHHQTFAKRLGSWRKAKAAAGLPITKPRPPKRPASQSYSDVELERAMLLAISALGPEVTHNQFRWWRKRHKAKLAAAGQRPVRIPNVEALRRLAPADNGTWRQARDVVLARHPELLSDTDDVRIAA